MKKTPYPPRAIAGLDEPLASALERVASLAYHRAEWGSETLERLWRVSTKVQRPEDRRRVRNLHQWLQVPLTLWPVHVDALARHVIRNLNRMGRTDATAALALDLLGPVPNDFDLVAIAAHEHLAQQGRYEGLVHNRGKFDEVETALIENREFQREWSWIKGRFRVEEYQDRKGIVRRSMVPERNYRQEWGREWTTARARFQAVFDVFCWWWNLYGMEGDRPLPNKLTVNLTPLGTMIFIPRYWSFDHRRDLDWPRFKRLHRALGARNQGPKLGAIRQAIVERARRTDRHWQEATRKGLKGVEREDYVIQKTGLPAGTEATMLRRLRSALTRSARNRG